MSTPSVSVIVIAYNEEENVEPVLGELRSWIHEHEPRTEIVFVDDGSTDATSEKARRALEGANAIFVRHSENLGIGAAIKSGVRAAQSAWITFMPADGQIAPEVLGALLSASKTSDVDLVMSVYSRRDDGKHRAFLSWSVRALIRAIHGVDLQSDGPYLFRRTHFVPEELPPNTFFLNFEFPIRAIAAGVRTKVIVVPCRPRRAGHSKSVGLRRIAGVARDLVDLRIRRLEAWTGL